MVFQAKFHPDYWQKNRVATFALLIVLESIFKWKVFIVVSLS